MTLKEQQDHVRLVLLNDLIEVIKQDYAEDSLPGSEYRLACNDIVELLEVMKDNFKPYD